MKTESILALITLFWIVCGLVQTKMDKIYNSDDVGWIEVLINLFAGPIKLVCKLVSDYL